MSGPLENYLKIKDKIRKKCLELKRTEDSVKLLAVSKEQTYQSIRALHQLGQMDFGENYVQEFKKKKETLQELTPPIRWHFIGHLQTNKVKELVGEVFLFHSIDRWALAQKIDQVAQKRKTVCEGFVEIDLGHEETKSGLPENQIEDFLSQLNLLTHLQIRGLMIIPPFSEDPETTRPYFRRLREILFDLNRKSIYKAPLTELSMGMSQDYPVAIEEGATWVRIGRSLFGERKKHLL